MKAKEDLRTKKTKTAIKKAFIELVSEKGYAQISVSEIAERAVINRNTFYLHYESKDQLVESLLHEVLDVQNDRMIAVTKRLSFDEKHVREIYLFIAFKALFALLMEEIEFYRVLLKDDDLSNYIARLGTLIKKELNDFFNLNSEKGKLMSDFVYAGVIGVVRSWLSLPDPKKHIVDTANSLSKYVYVCFKEALK